MRYCSLLFRTFGGASCKAKINVRSLSHPLHGCWSGAAVKDIPIVSSDKDKKDEMYRVEIKWAKIILFR